MKISGMDAPNVNFTRTQEDTTAPKEAKIEIKEHFTAANNVLDTKNISRLTNTEKKELPVPEKIVIDAIEKANKAISGGTRRFEFAIHEKTKEIMIKVIDADTNEIIREIPPEKTLDMVAKMWELSGIMVDERR